MLGCHLCDQRSIFLTDFIVEIVSPVVGVPNKHLSVEHGCVTELRAVPAAEQAPGQLALVHHGGHHKACFLQGFLPELKALELGHQLVPLPKEETLIYTKKTPLLSLLTTNVT